MYFTWVTVGCDPCEIPQKIYRFTCNVSAVWLPWAMVGMAVNGFANCQCQNYRVAESRDEGHLTTDRGYLDALCR